MRNLVYLLILVGVVMVSSCSCVLSQVPPQVVYADSANCEAALPDYTPIVVASDNCGEVALSQDPLPGTVLSPANPYIDVLITATDEAGNAAFLNISVSLVDTIPPILEWPEGVASMSPDDVVKMYGTWEQAVKGYGIAQWIYDMSWKPDTLQFANDTVYNNLYFFHHTIGLTVEEYNEWTAIGGGQ